MKILYPCVLFVIMSACSSTQIFYSYSKQTDFDTYRTFNFIVDEALLPSDSTGRKLLINAVTDQLRARGLSIQVRSPDLLVDVKLLIQKMKKVMPMSGRSVFISSKLYVQSEPTYKTEEYDVATIFIRIIDTYNKQMVWQAHGSRTIFGTPAKSDVHRAVVQLLKKYPHE